MTDTAALFARDFDSLTVGDRFVTSGRPVTESDVVAFAALTGDRHPQHTDVRWAEGSLFGERIAHGLLVLSFAVGLVSLDPERVVALRRVRDAVFKQPVRLGETIHVDGRIDELAPIDRALGLVLSTWKVCNDRGSTAVRARVEVLWRRDRPAVPDESAYVAGVVPL